MVNPMVTSRVEGDDPCGPDMRWDPACIQLNYGMQAAVARGDDSVLDAESEDANVPVFRELVEAAEDLGRKTKDVRILAIHAEASWRDRGLAAFADAMEGLVAVVETWPDPDTGVHPRADEEDGDLGERVAPLSRLLQLVPALASTVGWGAVREVSQRQEAAEALRGVFERWDERLGPAFGQELPPPREAWAVLSRLLGVVSDSRSQTTGESAVADPPPDDAWDLIEQAATQMERQDRHSPALPILQLLARWRSVGLIAIAEAMRVSGVALEQLLESVRKQLNPPR